MRVYIIGNDGITLCRTAPAAVNNGEIAVASNEELHAAPLSAKRLLALWNALPDVEKRKKVGDRDALINQLWGSRRQTPSQVGILLRHCPGTPARRRPSTTRLSISPVSGLLLCIQASENWGLRSSKVARALTATSISPCIAAAAANIK